MSSPSAASEITSGFDLLLPLLLPSFHSISKCMKLWPRPQPQAPGIGWADWLFFLPYCLRLQNFTGLQIKAAEHLDQREHDTTLTRRVHKNPRPSVRRAGGTDVGSLLPGDGELAEVLLCERRRNER